MAKAPQYLQAPDVSPVNLHFGDSSWKGLEAIKTRGGRKGLRGLEHPAFPGGPRGLVWRWERVDVRRDWRGLSSPGQICQREAWGR